MHTHTLVKRFAQVVVSGSLISNTFLPAISKQVLKISLYPTTIRKRKTKLKVKNVITGTMFCLHGYRLIKDMAVSLSEV